MSPFKLKKRKKTKSKKPKIGAVMNPTVDFFERERVMRRTTHWMWRLVPYLREKNKEQCGSCQMMGRCHRIPLDRKITAKLLRGKKCPDHKSMWKAITGKEEPYDWGF